ncbi:bifunctional UDP-N-acetylglucosamine diphosphorylase/glucosamine-1-phosphate N-acetyltransferase GlmU [Agaribacterium haliotis]|uniref:bifunctional UDP-N-acetylglucosamine diphosphorylase/glucosamine-1-phosphate N-acetyltransferase GlmU n=1 Tax=Agaribacterium haliotis TaxID=2013869 RepID=UPI000BB59F08|nr:bifunctional UDP-N-acetylglucosamine diphosphorylase/glucosamine-1-phosphate N-acetyltransferase GlmU [Agaribacterium haliotis]
MTDVVILAAGKGTRMRSSKPKVLHTVGGKALVQHVIDCAADLDANKTIVVVGHGGEQVKESVAGDGLVFVEQTEQLGTGHAVAQALPELNNDDAVLILYGDVPLIKKSTLAKLLEGVSANSMGLLTVELADPTGYGRIIRSNSLDGKGEVEAIVEQKDASAEQLAITEGNTGVMAVSAALLHKWLPALSNENAQGEYYLTDIIAMARSEGLSVNAVVADSETEVAGINNRAQQAELERAFQLDQANELMAQGLCLKDPARFDLRGSLEVGMDCEIDVNCVIEGAVKLGNNVTLGPNCVLKDVEIADNVAVDANSVLESSKVGSNCTIGPYARLRPGTVLADGAKIGNFVETKKAHIGLGSKVNHLSYVGDAEVGEGVNIGAGTITCNYDGVNKSKTEIGDGAFIGSNSALVAPVKVGKMATVAAGSVVTKDSDDDQLVISRAKQRNLDGWQRPTKKS